MCIRDRTDPKGDRSKAPHLQEDPDLFLRVVERRPDGIVVRGAKVHQTGVCNSHEIIVMPTISMGPDDKDYAVSFAVPMDTEGLFMIIGRQSCDTRKMEDVYKRQMEYRARFRLVCTNCAIKSNSDCAAASQSKGCGVFWSMK